MIILNIIKIEDNNYITNVSLKDDNKHD